MNRPIPPDSPPNVIRMSSDQPCIESVFIWLLIRAEELINIDKIRIKENEPKSFLIEGFLIIIGIPIRNMDYVLNNV